MFPAAAHVTRLEITLRLEFNRRSYHSGNDTVNK